MNTESKHTFIHRFLVYKNDEMKCLKLTSDKVPAPKHHSNKSLMVYEG